MGLSLCQTPTGIGDSSISPIFQDLVQDSPQDRTTSIHVQLERLSKVGIGQNGHCGAEMLKFVKGPLAPVIPDDGIPLLACIFIVCQFVQGPGICANLGIDQ